MQKLNDAVKGGTQLGKYLQATAAKLSAGTLRVGFLEGATYPPAERNADKLLKGLDKLNRVGPFARRAKAPAVGPAALTKGAAPSSLRAYRARRKAAAPNIVGPPAPDRVLFVATVAAWNNFGNARIPARPFFSNMIAHDSGNWGPILAKLLQKNKNGDRALKLLGEHIKDKLVKAIVDWPADNAPLTVAIKGFDKGLVDRGIMQRSVGVEIKK